jgi:APA family basic amino acid/polyamine antiporter
MENNESTERTLSGLTATMLVVATMIGTGVFTSTGFMVQDLGSPAAILISWLIGGVLALCGALSFAELAVLMPRNGGEYNLLTRIYHPAVGFVAGWISFIVGFGASIASSALAFGTYLQALFPVNPQVAAILLIIAVSLIHAFKTEAGASFQDWFTLLKIFLIIVFIAGGLFAGNHIEISSSKPVTDVILSPVFAIGLIYVSFAYSGWESSAYIAGEIRNPAKLLPLSLIGGTLIVTLLYLGLNLTFLLNVPQSELSGVVEVGQVTAKYIFGENGALIMSGIIAFGLISSVGSMSMAGPRIYQTMGEDYRRLAFLSKKSKYGAPANAIFFQSVVAILMLLTASFDTLLKYIGFTLSLVAGLAVLGVIVLRFKLPDAPRLYKTWGYPFTPVLFILLSLWMIIFSIYEDPKVCLTGFGTIASGLIVYFIVKEKSANKP